MRGLNYKLQFEREHIMLLLVFDIGLNFKSNIFPNMNGWFWFGGCHRRRKSEVCVEVVPGALPLT